MGVFKIGKKYRTNPMSLEPGGVSVFTREKNGIIKEYDKVKIPWAYIKKIKKENPDINCWWTDPNDIHYI